MSSQHEDIVNYKWDNNTYTGYRLHFNFDLAKSGLKRCIHVEAWDHRVIIEDWWCNTVEEAMRILSQFFEIDTDKESATLIPRFDSALSAA